MLLQRAALAVAGRAAAAARNHVRRQSTNAFGSSLPDVIEKAGWEGAWQANVTPWDAGKPAPLIKHLLKTGQLPDGPVLVPGVGSGYDAIEFAKLGRRTLGLDISTTAVARARRVAAQDDAAQALVDAGSLEFKVADLFTFPVPRDISGGSGYSVVFDYTLLPALPPDLWPQWASAMKRLVHPTKGELVVLLFPVGNHKGGPPYALNPTKISDLLAEHDFDAVSLEPVPPELSHKARAGREYIGRWRLSDHRFPRIHFKEYQ